MLEVGIKAPDFELPDQNGKIHRLSDYTGKKVILYFYPKDNTAGCIEGSYPRYPSGSGCRHEKLCRGYCQSDW